MAAYKKKSKPITERTEVKGLVDMEVPWVGGAIKLTWPATNRSVMVVICALFCMLTIVLPACCYIIFIGADPENVSRVGRIFSREDGRKPEKIPVKNDDGEIEIIEVCPPCPLCDDFIPCSPPVPCQCVTPTPSKLEPVRDDGL